MNRFNIVSNSLMSQKNDDDEDDNDDKADEEPENEENPAVTESVESTDVSERPSDQNSDVNVHTDLKVEINNQEEDSLDPYIGYVLSHEVKKIEVELPEDNQLETKMTDASYWKVPLDTVALADLLADYE